LHACRVARTCVCVGRARPTPLRFGSYPYRPEVAAREQNLRCVSCCLAAPTRLYVLGCKGEGGNSVPAVLTVSPLC
jgi:hypothetical protein